LFLFSSLLFSNNLSAKNVDLETAKRVAINYFSTEAALSKTVLKITEVIPFENKGELAFRIINFNPKGYIVVSAEDNTIPVLGYGLESNFTANDAPPALLDLLSEYAQEITAIRKQNIVADESIVNKWDLYSSTNYAPLKSYSPGTWLLNTTWGQSSGYNRFCPEDPTTHLLSKVGCTPVAMGQILRYWECRVFPDNTSHYYCDSIQDWLTVHFYNESYNWGAMHNSQSDDDNAKLLYHCGVASEAEYTSHGTGASLNNARFGFMNYFGFYANPVKWKKNNESTWVNMLKAEIDSYRPVLYAGAKTDSSAGHAWVIDGYDSNNKFHCNWGWRNSNGYNNFYSLSGLTPGPHNFNSRQRAVMNIYPKLDACSSIPGPLHVCCSNTSYSVSIPSTASVVWSKTGSLQQVGGNTSSTYTVIASSCSQNGAGALTATIKNSQGATFLTRSKNVNVMGASPSDINLVVMGNLSGQQVNQYMLCPNTGYILICEYDDVICTASNYNWILPSGMTLINSSQNWAYINTNSSGGGILTLKAQTCCGPNITIMSEVLATDGYDCDGWYMSFSPNPTTGETTLLIESKTEDLGLKSASTEPVFDENTEWELEVYSPSQALKEKRTKLKGNSTIIQTQSWKEGVYMVRVKYKGEILTGKLVVKK